ncbi:MAG TPA: hypothetical protein VLU91_09430 [Nitrososphaerales archaeon]|nr:hypothetical protein [Nitrososphaerales archaeon]
MKLAPLIAVQVVAFLLIIGETYLFFNVVVPIGQFPHNLGEYTGYALLKVFLTLGLGVLWFLVTLGMTRLYVRSKLRTPTPTPSS